MKIPSIRIALAVGMVSLMGLAANVNGADQVKKDKDDADGSRYSDKSHRSDWEKGKEELARNLKIGEDRDFYRKELEKMGYQITSTNADKPDYAEYEVVKGDRTYEVAIDFDKNSHRASKVDVGTNMWHAKGTEEALKRNQDKSQAKR